MQLYFVRESGQLDATWALTWPDGPRNAEALLARPGGPLYLVSKSERGRSEVMRVPAGAPAAQSSCVSAMFSGTTSQIAVWQPAEVS